MPSEKFFVKEDLYNKLEELSKEFEIIGPRELPNKGIFYQSLKNTRDLYLGEGFAIEPIKRFFLKPSEWIFDERFRENKNILEGIPLPADKRIIISVRPCETRGLTLLDKVFDSDYKDNFYINNRKRTIIIGLACNKPAKNCFCTSMGGSPIESRGMDVLIFDMDRGLIAEILTDRGRELFASIGEGLNEGQRRLLKEDKEKKKDLVEKKLSPPEGKELDKIFESDYWEDVSRPCIGCGICTYLCPTCHCFDLVDERRKRLRCYDSCSFPDFTLEASGVNPRPTKKERYRQRVFHKFDYFKKNFGENLCVGCGRCIRHCPVKIDIADIVDKVPGLKKE